VPAKRDATHITFPVRSVLLGREKVQSLKIPNFKTEEGSILYKNTVGRLISPRVAQVLLTRVTEQLNPDKHHTILDLGCGPGTVCLPLAKEFPGLAITAVDTSDSMVQLAKSEAEKLGLRNIRFGDMDAGHIGVSNDAFDIVLCNLAFPFFARPYDSMREILSVMRPQAAAFHLLDYATSDMKSELADAINAKYPNGFRMHYEVELLTGTRAV
jgi:ubiquinone/menaquinone biosynthesis C-methylase UbiE